MPRALVITALVLLSPLPALAQALELPVGARVRVNATVAYETRQTTGAVVRVTGDSLVLAKLDAVERPFALSSLTSVQISRGRSRTKGALKGLLIGTGILAGLTLLSIASAGEAEGGAFVAIIGLPVFGGIGALFGAMIGRERWEAVPR